MAVRRGRGEGELRDRDQQILNRLAQIQHKVDALEQTQAFTLRAEEEKHSESVRTIFKRSKRRAQVYLAANGQRSVQEIASHLGLKSPNVSRELAVLGEEGLLEIVDTDRGSNLWGKKPLDRTLRITRFLCSEYGLEKDGKQPGRKKSTRRKPTTAKRRR